MLLRGLAPFCRSLVSAIENASACGRAASTSSSAWSTGPTAATAAFQTSAAQGSPSSSNSSSSTASSITSVSSKQRGNAPLAAPWTPTSMLIKRKTYQKRSRFLIQTLEAEQQQQLASGRQIPQFRSGDILEVTTVVPEADRRVYTYKGVCVAKANKGPRSWFKLYNVFPDAGGFVQHFPLYMPDLLSVKVVGRLPRAKRSKLYHLLEDESPKHIYQTGVEMQKQ